MCCQMLKNKSAIDEEVEQSRESRMRSLLDNLCIEWRRESSSDTTGFAYNDHHISIDSDDSSGVVFTGDTLRDTLISGDDEYD